MDDTVTLGHTGLADAARSASAASGFEIVGHSIDLIGVCSSCRS
jgi:Fe2+ or Zn2+ uptake regulation protein